MEESDIEGLATHGGPESCAGARKDAGEALTGAVQAGLSSRVMSDVRGAHAIMTAEGHTATGAIASLPRTPRGLRTMACTEAPCARTGRAHRRPSPDQGRAARGRRSP